MQRISHNLSRNECVQAFGLGNEGWNYKTIGQILGVSHITISHVFQRFRKTSEYTRRPGQGKPRVTTAVQDRFLRIRALRERFTTSRIRTWSTPQTTSYRSIVDPSSSPS
jgi:transposase